MPECRIVFRLKSICRAMNSNHKQTAVITGASSGIGLGLTHGFLEAGFNVVANSRNATSSGTLTSASDLLLVNGDVGELATARNLIDRALILLGHKRTFSCRIVLWDHVSPRQAHKRNASRHIWMAWR